MKTIPTRHRMSRTAMTLTIWLSMADILPHQRAEHRQVHPHGPDASPPRYPEGTGPVTHSGP